jgi:hypothetical protein
MKDLAADLTTSSSPPAVRAASTVSSNSDESSESSSDGDNDDDHVAPPKGNNNKFLQAMPTTESESSSTVTSADQERQDVVDVFVPSSVGVSILSGIVNATGWVLFSLYFPFMLAPLAATATYHPAYYNYDPTKSHFDNTIWTYGTDYALAVVMIAVVYTILQHSRPGLTDRLCYRSSSLLALYGISVIAGGISHHFFTTLESRNSTTFRILWTVCVGTVCLASTSMGMSGTEVIRRFQHYERQRKEPNTVESSLLQKVPLLSDSFWCAFGATVAVVCAVGGMSFQRPACDIFIAGITQSPSTFYCMIFFFVVRHPHVERWAKVVGFAGFILNAPLLPMYPLLVQYTDWTLASVNTLLHCWLCVAWTMQGISMRHVIRALVLDSEEAEEADTTKMKTKKVN